MSDSLRTYLRELRIKKGISQEKTADAIGWSIRSYSEWETGKSEDIKARYLIRLVTLLNASWESITNLELDPQPKESGPREAEPAYEAGDNQLNTLVDQLWSDEALRNAFLIFWAGWRASK